MKCATMVRLGLVASCVFFLGACVDIETKVELKGGGSGTLELIYTVSSALVQLGSTASPTVSLPLPIEREDFRQTVAAIPGLSLQSYERKDFPDRSVVQARLTFESLDGLNRLFGGSEPVFSQRQEGNDRVFVVRVASGSPTPLDPKTKEFINAFFSTYALKFHITLPGNVKRAVPTEGAVEGSTAKWSVPILRVLEADAPIVWQIFW